MALSLDDRLLGEKVHNYCSSSEDEEEQDDDGKSPAPRPPKFIPEAEISSGAAINTGPKGVINDWRKYKQLETENREQQEKEREKLIKKLSITCRSHLDDEKEKEKDGKFLEDWDEELDELEEEFLKEYRAKRIEEMRRAIENIPRFGNVLEINKDQFVEEIDKENPQVTIIVHLYEDKVKACRCMHRCIESLAEEYTTVKFCKLKASQAKLSHSFSINGVPAILIYKKGELIGNFVRICDDLGEDFYPSDLEGFLLEHGFLPEKSLIPGMIRAPAQQEDSSGSDID